MAEIFPSNIVKMKFGGFISLNISQLKFLVFLDIKIFGIDF